MIITTDRVHFQRKVDTAGGFLDTKKIPVYT